MKLKVTYADGETVETNAGPRAEVALERQYGLGLLQALDWKAGTARVEYLYYLGWAALHFGGPESDKDYDDFLARIEDVEPVDAEPEGPTKPARRKRASPS